MFEIKENKNCCDTKEMQTKAIFITINLFLPPHQACRILIPHPGTQPVPPAFGVQSRNCRTAREVPQQIFLSVNVCVHIHTLIYVSHIYNISDQIRSVTQSCPTLCDPRNRSTPGLPVHHQLPFTQTHVHRVSDAIQPSHPLSSPSPLAPNPSQHQSLFQ